MPKQHLRPRLFQIALQFAHRREAERRAPIDLGGRELDWKATFGFTTGQDKRKRPLVARAVALGVWTQRVIMHMEQGDDETLEGGMCLKCGVEQETWEH
eukprot:8725081-Alexandrium_andersonii.AAC.1